MQKITPLQCAQCGSHDISQARGHFVCNYCGTIHYGGGAGGRFAAARAFVRRHRAAALMSVILVAVIVASIAYVAGRVTPGPAGTGEYGGEGGSGAIVRGRDSIEPEKKVDAVFRDIAALPDGIGNIYFIGMFENTGEAIVYPKAEIALFNAKGDKVAVAHGYGIRSHLYPGEATPVQVLVSDAPSYASVRSIGTPEVPSYFQERPDISISSLSLKRPVNSISRYRVTGIVKNRSGMNARYVHVAAVVFDLAGKIVGYGDGFIGQTILASGEEAPFSVEIHLMKGSPARFLVDYNATPDKGSR